LSCLKPNELGNYKNLAGNYATGVVARFIGLKGDFRLNIHEPGLTKGHENRPTLL